MKINYLYAINLILFIGCENNIKKDEVNEEQIIEFKQEIKSIPQECIIENNNNIGDDNLYSYQWHLKLLETESIWSSYQGRDIKVAIVDSGIECKHPDLNKNINFNLSYRYSDGSNNPSPTQQQLNETPIESAHGTACAGIIGAVKDNSLGVIGIAPKVSLVGLNAFSSGLDADFEDSLQKNVDISNNSWGGGDSNYLYDDPSALRGIDYGIKYGRNGLGIIYIFASGNEGNNANYSILHGSPYVINVGAVNHLQKVPDFSNFGENVAVVAPAGDEKVGIYTTDLMGWLYGLDSIVFRTHGFKDKTGDYTGLMNGTSSAVPVVSGVVALMLEANKNLTYREVKYILMKTAKIPKDEPYSINGANLKFSPKYGFGIISAIDSVKMAENFTPLSERKVISKTDLIPHRLYYNEPYHVNFDINQSLKVEHVQLKLSIESDSNNISDLKIVIKSPSGTNSELISGKNLLYGDLTNWEFNSLRFLDENSFGNWEIIIEDMDKFGTNYKLKSLNLNILVR